MFAGLLLTRLADLPTAGILEDITLAGWVTGSLVTVKVIYQAVLPTSRVPFRKYFFGKYHMYKRDSNLESFCFLVKSVLMRREHKYRTRTLITHGLYILNPLFDDHKCFFKKDFFRQILP